MKPCEEIIVTIKIVDKGRDIDMELPTFMPWQELNFKILECLQDSMPEEYGSYCKLNAMYKGILLNDDETLASMGIWDGSIIWCTLEHKEGE